MPALEQLKEALPHFPPFVVELGEVAVFDKTRVVYLELVRGQAQLEKLHRILNINALHYDEPYQYHPHVTLAQGPCVVADTDNKVQIAKERWAEFRLPRTFTVDTVMFVQNGGCQGWLDLNELSVGA